MRTLNLNVKRDPEYTVRTLVSAKWVTNKNTEAKAGNNYNKDV